MFEVHAYLNRLHTKLGKGIDLSEKICQTKSSIFCFLKDQARTTMFCSRVQALEAIERCTRFFFQQCARQKGFWPRVKMEGGLVSDPGQITEAVEDNFSRSIENVPVDSSQMAGFLDHLNNWVSPEELELLERPASLEELSFAVECLAMN